MPPPIPRCSSWAYSSLNSPSHFNLPRYGSRVGLHIVLFEACLAFTRVAACTLALSPIRDPLIEGFSHFVTSMTAPIASGWSGCRVGLAPTGKRRLVTAHANNGHRKSDLAGLAQSRGDRVHEVVVRERLQKNPQVVELFQDVDITIASDEDDWQSWPHRADHLRKLAAAHFRHGEVREN